MRILLHTPAIKPNWFCVESIADIDINGLEVDWYLNLDQPSIIKYDNNSTESNPKWRDYLAEKMNRARKVFLNGNYDYLVNIEHDHIFHPKTLKLLLDFAKEDIYISALYVPRPSRNPRNVFVFNKLVGNKQVWLDKKEAVKYDLIETFISPFGFTIFGRKVIENCEFDNGIDGGFAWKAHKCGFKSYVLTIARIGHIERNGFVFWPHC